MTKEQNVLEMAAQFVTPNNLPDIIRNKELLDFADALTKPMEEENKRLEHALNTALEMIAEQQKLIDHWMIMTNTYADNLELHKAKIAELEARIAEQQKELLECQKGALVLSGLCNEKQKELDDCKDAVVKLRNYLEEECGDKCNAEYNPCAARVLLSETSAIVEGYKK